MSNQVSRPNFGAKKFKITLMAGAAVMALSTAAIAQDVINEEEDMLVLEPISIDAKADVITGGVQIEEEELDRIDAANMRDVFRQQPGVAVSSPLGISQQIHVNGVEDTNLNIDIDGARQANKTYHHLGTTVMDPSILKAVKVETGVAPADAGPNALGGTISMETKDGRDIVDPGEIFGGYGKLSYNSNTEGLTSDFTVASRYEGLDFMLFGTKATGNDYEDGDGNEVGGTKPVVENFLFKTGFTSDNGYRFKLSANQFDDSAVRPGRLDFTFPNGKASPVKYSRDNYVFSFGDETPTDMLDPKLTFAYTRTNLSMKTSLPFGAYTLFDLYTQIKTYNGKASNTFTTDLGKITVGTDFYYDNGYGGRNGNRWTEEATNIGGFAQARLSLSDDLRTSFGARFDRSSLEGTDNSNHRDSGFSVNGNLEYDLLKELMVYGGASSTFGGMQLAEMGFYNTSPASYEGIEGSRATNYKIGSVVEVDKLTLDGNMYLTRINDVSDLGNLTDRSAATTVDSRGWNISAKYDYGDGFARLGVSHNNLRVNSGYLLTTSADYRGQDAGDSITFEVNHSFPEYGLTLGTTNEAMLPDDSQLGITGSGLDGYFVSNIHADWYPEWVDGLNLRFDVKNLFDHMYADRMNVAGDTNDSGVATNGVRSAFYEPGRTFILTAKYDF